ncbi:hypothetical protein O181_059697 [Austropuccinia psidii MF-1]|uniref:Uncharacterized protein n=1 Tax=Austropuccinia psidii MF-1 TaxID=1389203 RepID=A0A9Q3EH60_9BASI|nr:hypothetical protein [Austropuccinia psidii MF-1]
MSRRKFDLEDLRAAPINSTSKSGAQFKHQVEIDRLGEGITPCLTNSNRTRNYEIRAHFKKSISGDLNNSIEEEDEAMQAYQLLSRRVEKHSWSHLMSLFDELINGLDASTHLYKSYVAIKKNVSNLKSALGSIWDDNALVAMFFHHWNKQFLHEISTAMDAKLSLDDKVQIRAEDILQVAQCFQKQNNTLSLSPPPLVLASSSSHHQHSQQTSGVCLPPQKPATPVQ